MKKLLASPQKRGFLKKYQGILAPMLDRRSRLGLTISVGVALGAWLFVGCGPAAAPPPAPPPKPTPSAAPAPLAVVPPEPEPPLVPLRTGALAPLEDPPLELSVHARADDGAFEILELDWPLPPSPDGVSSNSGVVLLSNWRAATVAVEPALDAFAFFQSGVEVKDKQATSVLQIWIRRKKSQAPVDGTLYMGAYWGSPGHRQHFHAPLDGRLRSEPTLVKTWAKGLTDSLSRRADAPGQFAARRLAERYLGPQPAPRAEPGPGPKRAARRDPTLDASFELSQLMDTTTGRVSLQRALEQHRGLFLAVAKQKQTIPVEQLMAPNLARHPWPTLQAALHQSAPDEPLARAVPAEFYFLRARDFARFLALLDVVDTFAEPAADLLDRHTEARDTFARYETELGLERSALTRLLGPAVVTDVALVGSDPYVHEGTDVTLIFRVKSPALFATALTASLAKHAAEHPGLKETTLHEDGVTITLSRSSDGRIRRQRATVGEFELVSNSANALRRVIATLKGKHPSLAAEPDFSYMLARDAGTPNDVLAYLGDRFVSTVVGPAQKIGEARRQIALGELLAPGYAALALGLIDGRGPKSTAELLASRLLLRSELRHADGSAIDWEPGRAPHSAWGAPALLEPLIDLPAVTRATAAEKSGYERFARSYEALWSDHIDPIALRLTEAPGADGRVVTADLRVLPALRREYRDLIGTVGKQRLRVPALLAGLSGAIGLGADADLRHELSQMSRFIGGGKSFAFDWLGDYALVGVTARNALANAAHQEWFNRIELPRSADTPPPPSSFLSQSTATLPLYVALGVRSRVGAGLFLTALRGLAREAAPGVAEWGTGASYHGQEVVAVHFREHDVRGALYYALTENALVLSLNETVLHQALDLLAAHPPVALAAGQVPPADAGQLVVELSPEKGDALYQALAWSGAEAMLERAEESQTLAGAVLLGARELGADSAAVRERMRAYLGAVVVTPEGKDYVLAPEGVKDPDHGTPYAPVFPELPVPGSPLERVLSGLRRVRTALSFDDEPGGAPDNPLTSLHARVTLELR